MARFSRAIVALFLLFGLLASDYPSRLPDPASEVCTILLTQVLRIPVSTLRAQEAPESVDASPASLTIYRGATDEPPEGPTGFDVLDDGSLLITDPLRSRISHFGAGGEFRGAWKIGFAADSLTVNENGVALVREASTGKSYAFDREGQARPTEGVPQLKQAEARALSGKNGTVTRPAINSAHGGTLAVELNKPGLTLLSLESLVTDHKGDTYVALETTGNGNATEAVTLNKYVRRYSSDGKLLCEISDIPLDYYVPPVDELRVHKGRVYQLQTTASEVRINVWDTNPLCHQPPH